MRNAEKIESLAGDRGYDDQSLRDALNSEGVRPLLRHRLFAALRSRTQRAVGQQIIRPSPDGRDRLFGHQASVRPRCPPLRLVPRVP
ncbi:hypothetical protein [Halorubrum sp. AJ67]|uniref:hypothetical protein n=1 Tax=Halorubrum sp. AJ67 TaxID=1173487 RepID=UPI0034E07AC5